MPKLYNNQNPSSITIAGITYYSDKNGVFDVPYTIVPALKKRGFVDAALYLQELTKAETEQQTESTPVQKTVVSVTNQAVISKPKAPVDNV